MKMRALKTQDELMQPTKKKSMRVPGAGRKEVVPEISKALFSWFVDVRVQRRGRMSMKLFNAKCNELYIEFKRKKSEDGQELTEEEKEMKFGKSWIKKWKKDYRVSLKKPNKRYALNNDVRHRRIMKFLKKYLQSEKLFFEKAQHRSTNFASRPDAAAQT